MATELKDKNVKQWELQSKTNLKLEELQIESVQIWDKNSKQKQFRQF